MPNRFSANTRPEYYGPSGMESADAISNAMWRLDSTMNRNKQQDAENARRDGYLDIAGDRNRRDEGRYDIDRYDSGWRDGKPPIDPGFSPPTPSGPVFPTDPGFTAPPQQDEWDVGQASGVPEAALGALSPRQGSSAPPPLDQMPQGPPSPMATPAGRMAILGQQYAPLPGGGYIDPAATPEARRSAEWDRQEGAKQSEWDRQEAARQKARAAEREGANTEWGRRDQIDFDQARQLEGIRQSGYDRRARGGGGSAGSNGAKPGYYDDGTIDPGAPETLDKEITNLNAGIDDARARAAMEAGDGYTNMGEGETPAYLDAIAQLDRMTARRDSSIAARSGNAEIQGKYRRDADQGGDRAKAFEQRVLGLQAKRQKLLDAGNYDPKAVEKAYNEDVARIARQYGVTQQPGRR